MNLQIEKWEEWFSKNQTGIFQDLIHFLKFKSISTDSHFKTECRLCATWLEEYLKKMGMQTEIWETPGLPVIFAQTRQETGRPTLLLYQHYDVQPVDPLTLWVSDPFQPVIKEGAIYARGAQDNKGQCFYSITALKALFELCQPLNFNIKVFIEGEEESGSAGTSAILHKKAKELQSDYLLVVDSGIPEPGTPAISLGMRGILTMEVTCRCADSDLHSGWLGGIALNPLRVLSTAFATLWDEKGKVTVPHFYDRVKNLSSSELSQFDIEVSGERLQREFGLRGMNPEPGYSLGESNVLRPTIEINGMEGGYTGEGFKTVIPAVAHAKLSCRLVPDQDPEIIFSQVKHHLEQKVPKGVDLEVKLLHGAKAFRSHPNSTVAKVAAKAYEDVLKKPCQNRLSGGSLPIMSLLAEVSKAESIAMGYGLDTDQIHAPNEHFGLDRFLQGFLTMGRIFSRFHEQS